jgi:hypothetical protein
LGGAGITVKEVQPAAVDVEVPHCQAAPPTTGVLNDEYSTTAGILDGVPEPKIAPMRAKGMNYMGHREA